MKKEIFCQVEITVSMYKLGEFSPDNYLNQSRQSCLIQNLFIGVTEKEVMEKIQKYFDSDPEELKRARSYAAIGVIVYNNDEKIEILNGDDWGCFKGQLIWDGMKKYGLNPDRDRAVRRFPFNLE